MAEKRARVSDYAKQGRDEKSEMREHADTATSGEEPVLDAWRTPTISFNALRRARTTIEDFCKSYFFYHDLSIPESLFEHLDILIFVEATIYQMDELNEALCGRMEEGDGKETRTGEMQGTENARGREEELLPGSCQLREVLHSLGFMDDRLKSELDAGLEYWQNERQLCSAMRARGRTASTDTTGKAGMGHCPFSAQDVHTCSLGKSFDYRVLNLLLYRITHRDYDEQLLEFLAVDEHLVDINDDLVDYEEDVFANSFNIFRAYVHLYGRDAELRLVERISEWEERREKLLAALPKHIQDRVREREKEAAADAGDGSEKWTFPAPILDEKHYIQLYQQR